MRRYPRRKKRRGFVGRAFKGVLYVLTGLSLLVAGIYLADSFAGDYEATGRALTMFLLASTFMLTKIIVFDEHPSE